MRSKVTKQCVIRSIQLFTNAYGVTWKSVAIGRTKTDDVGQSIFMIAKNLRSVVRRVSRVHIPEARKWTPRFEAATVAAMTAWAVLGVSFNIVGTVADVADPVSSGDSFATWSNHVVLYLWLEEEVRREYSSGSGLQVSNDNAVFIDGTISVFLTCEVDQFLLWAA
jgi:hypothetical protein